MNPTLFDAPVGLSRANDPSTSREAAATITGAIEEEVMRVHAMWAGVFEDGLTDDELARALPKLYCRSVASARSRLSKAGRLVASGKVRLSNRGRRMTVWELAP